MQTSVRAASYLKCCVYQSRHGEVFTKLYVRAVELDRAEYSVCAHVLIPDAVMEIALVEAFEEELIKSLNAESVRCCLVSTYIAFTGVMDFLFMIADLPLFRKTVEKLFEPYKLLRLQLLIVQQSGWKLFDETLAIEEHGRPKVTVVLDELAKMYIHDKKTVDELIRLGSNPKNIHPIIYLFRGRKSKLRALTKHLLASGYREADDMDTGEKLEMYKTMPLELMAIHDESIQSAQHAERFGVSYAGWRGKVVT